jgi:hypothetical protein
VITGPLSWLQPQQCSYEGSNDTLELTGEINPNGLSTNYDFEYSEEKVESGFNSEHPAQFKTPTESAGSGTKLVKVSATINVKDPPLICWVVTYRLVGVNSAGTSYGESKRAFESI